jgi:hypothetical protein
LDAATDFVAGSENASDERNTTFEQKPAENLKNLIDPSNWCGYGRGIVPNSRFDQIK